MILAIAVIVTLYICAGFAATLYLGVTMSEALVSLILALLESGKERGTK